MPASYNDDPRKYKISQSRSFVFKPNANFVHTIKFMDRSFKKVDSKSKLTKEIKNWQNSEKKKYSDVKLQEKIIPRVKKYDSKQIGKLSLIRRSKSPSIEMIQKQKMKLEEYTGIVKAWLILKSYFDSFREFEKKKSTTNDPVKKKKMDDSWKKVLSGYKINLKNVGVNIRNHNDIIKLYNISKDSNDLKEINKSVEDSDGSLLPNTRNGLLIPYLGNVPVPDISDLPNVLPGCFFDPIRGVERQSYNASYNYRISITYPCGINWDGWDSSIRYCTRRVTLFGGSVSFNFEIGYEIDCCGISAWANSEMEACAIIANQEICASCEATVTAVAGISDYSGADLCSYGLGLNAIISCRVAGYTVYYGIIPMGWTVSGPCPNPAVARRICG